MRHIVADAQLDARYIDGTPGGAPAELTLRLLGPSDRPRQLQPIDAQPVVAIVFEDTDEQVHELFVPVPGVLLPTLTILLSKDERVGE